MNLDTIDFKILNQLRNDAKLTTKHLALQVNLSPTAVFERIKKLERNQVIAGYQAKINPFKVNLSFLAFCMVQLEKHTQEYLNVFESEVNQLEAVVECNHVSGSYDYLLKVRVKDMDAYREFIVTKLTKIPYIANTQSAFSMKVVK
ncbi:Lrp/AsnC family transcriptional regulator [Psychroflexus maritimus]|uniref:Lrp/AsnC family transcriptional regulator n=1 Tax=Psychroflexus maritimus TaxID=2714865 RepID=A0A967DYZ4_9FLAO|nr:Lrp/AsnC family transcriptional regulator [Psychroflexus maritimus]NGZ88897.1 Lrp/AsnC family transcriptional regulator [Psychroflexus maritimus]